jgi:threonine dehydrogenase-like Zn-dependent dehydrogenase
MGHEFTGVVSEVGSDVKTVAVGDKIVSPFTVSWYGKYRKLNHSPSIFYS